MQKTIGLDAFQLKVIAIIAMLIDHVSAIFFPDALWMRIIGRITMPIMAFFIAQGYAYTKDVKKYISRLLLASLVSVVPFGLLFGWGTSGNVMLTLALGLIAIWCEENIDSRGLQMLAILGLYALSLFGDWSILGVLMVQGFWRAKKNGKKWDASIIALLAVLAVMGLVFSISQYGTDLRQMIVFTLVNGGGCFFALPLLNLYNGEQGVKAKWLFYAFYPLHLTVILLVKMFLKI